MNIFILDPDPANAALSTPRKPSATRKPKPQIAATSFRTTMPLALAFRKKEPTQ